MLYDTAMIVDFGLNGDEKLKFDSLKHKIWEICPYFRICEAGENGDERALIFTATESKYEQIRYPSHQFVEGTEREILNIFTKHRRNYPITSGARV